MKLNVESIKGISESVLDKYNSQIENIKLNGAKSVDIDFTKLTEINDDVFENFILNPEKFIHIFSKKIEELYGLKLTPRFTNLSDAINVKIKELRTDLVGQFVKISGVIKRITEIKPMVTKAYFKCVRCDAEFPVEQKYFEGIRIPLECYKELGGCGKSIKNTHFEEVKEKHEMMDFQKITLEDALEELKGNEQPNRVEIHLTGDICGFAYPGEKIEISGYLDSTYSDKKSTIRDIFIRANSVRKIEPTYEEINLTPERTEEIKKLSQDDDICERVIKTIAPGIYGYEIEKEALALCLFGGVPKTFPDGSRKRGNIHILNVGEPGIGKSVLADEVSFYMNRVARVSGKAGTAVGLTIAATKDKDGTWILEAGAMVLANEGYVICDEFSRLSKDDRGAIHAGMDGRQIIDVAKAGLKASFKTRCSMIAIANPRYGRFDDNVPLVDNLAIDPALLDRFDLIFVKKDKPDEFLDREIAEHITNLHRLNGLGINPSIEPNLLKDYITYARRLKPKLPANINQLLVDFYVKMRQKNETSDEDNKIHITPRQLETVIRLSEASAKMHMREEVIQEDFERAKNILLYSMRMSCFDYETGNFDMDRIITKTKRSNIENLFLIIQIIRNKKNGITIEEIMSELERMGAKIDKSRLEEVLKRLYSESKVYNKKGKWTTTGDNYY